MNVLRQFRHNLIDKNMVLKWVYSAVFRMGKREQPRLCLQGKNKHRRSERNRHFPANSQIILYSRVGHSQTDESTGLVLSP